MACARHATRCGVARLAPEDRPRLFRIRRDDAKERHADSSRFALRQWFVRTFTGAAIHLDGGGPRWKHVPGRGSGPPLHWSGKHKPWNEALRTTKHFGFRTTRFHAQNLSAEQWVTGARTRALRPSVGAHVRVSTWIFDFTNACSLYKSTVRKHTHTHHTKRERETAHA